MDVISQKWPSDRAILFVHGVGNAKPGSYDPLVQQVEKLLGDKAKEHAIYFFYYDQVNEWFSQKQSAEPGFAKLVRFIASSVHELPEAKTTQLGEVIAQFAGDVIWPVLLPDARRAVRTALIRQLQQIRLDGIASDKQVREQHVSIIAHSMGCFHVYEALSHVAKEPSEMLAPASSEGVFKNVVLMASPVELIRTVADALGGFVPQRESMYTLSAPLAVPSELDAMNDPKFCTPNMVSITGNLDPVGGYFFRHQYAYMNFDHLVTRVDNQQVATVNGSEELSLASLLNGALQSHGPPDVTPTNPHDWSAYIASNAAELKGWLS